MRKFSFYETTNYRLENFLYWHRIPFFYQYKNDDYLTVWVYKDTPKFREVLAEFREIYAL